MPSPRNASSTGLQILTKMEPPTLAEWVDLAEWRRSLLLPHLSEMSLDSLGSLKYLRANHGRGHHSLSSDVFATPWNMRGIFDITPRPKSTVRTQSFWIWGLSQTGAWMTAHIQVVMEPLPNDFTGKAAERIFGHHVEGGTYGPTLTALDVCEATNVSPRRISRVLAKAIRAYAKQKEDEHAAAQGLLQHILGEEAALHARGVKIRP